MSGYLMAFAVILILLIAVFVKNIEIDNDITRYTPSEAVKLLENKNYYFVDVREPFEFKEGHLENSINIPMADLQKKFRELPKDKTVVLVCRSGNRSFRALSFLKDQGFENVADIKGGLLNWFKTGYTIKS